MILPYFIGLYGTLEFLESPNKCKKGAKRSQKEPDVVVCNNKIELHVRTQYVEFIKLLLKPIEKISNFHVKMY